MTEYSLLLFKFRNFKQYLTLYASPVGFILNFLLLFLIVKKSTPSMGGFKKVLLLTCVSEMTFSAVNFVFLVTLAVQDGTYFIVVDGVFGHFSPFWTRISFTCFVTMVYVSVYNTSVVFFYRYLVVCRSKNLNAWLFSLCLAPGWLLVILYAVTILSNCTVEPSKNPKMDKMLTAAGFPSNGSSFHDFVSCELKKFSSFSLISAVSFTTLVYGAVIMMSFAVQKRFKHLKSLLSKEEQRFHKEITTVLWIEALTPFITIVLPIYYDISAFVLPERPFDWFAELDWILTTMGPCFTAILKIISIKAFREAIISMIRQLCLRRRNDGDWFTRHKFFFSIFLPNTRIVRLTDIKSQSETRFKGLSDSLSDCESENLIKSSDYQLWNIYRTCDESYWGVDTDQAECYIEKSINTGEVNRGCTYESRNQEFEECATNSATYYYRCGTDYCNSRDVCNGWFKDDRRLINGRPAPDPVSSTSAPVPSTSAPVPSVPAHALGVPALFPNAPAPAPPPSPKSTGTRCDAPTLVILVLLFGIYFIV